MHGTASSAQQCFADNYLPVDSYVTVLRSYNPGILLSTYLGSVLGSKLKRKWSKLGWFQLQVMLHAASAAQRKACVDLSKSGVEFRHCF